MAWALPESTRVPVPLPLKVTPLPRLPRVRVPWPTLRVVVRVSPSTSATLMALPLAVLKVWLPSSSRVWAPGTLLTGASLIGLITSCSVPVVLREPSLRV